MNKKIARNIGIVSAIFIVTFSIMLITNYFQVRGATPLQTEVMETLKELNIQDPENIALQEQIRELDLIARRAYFTGLNHLKAGLYILLGILAVLIICVRYYFEGDKDIPDKELDPIDEWLEKTKARKYIIRGAVGLAAVALFFVIITSPHLKADQIPEESEQTELIAEAFETEGIDNYENIVVSDSIDETSEETDSSLIETNEEEAVEEEIVTPVISNVTHNAFRGNNSNGISSAKGLPVEWDLSSGTNIAWQKDVPRQGYNSPVINGNKVFFSGADERVRELYCYDLNSGEQLWSLEATNIPGSPSQMPRTTEDTGLAASTVATNGNRVCAIFATGDIICADMEGNRLWAKNLGVPDNHYGYASSLLIYGGSVIVQYDNVNTSKVMALDLTSGAERWSKERNQTITWSSPIIAMVNNSPQLILMGNPAITSYNPANGDQLWQIDAMSGEVGSSACSSDGIIFGANEYAKLVAIDGTDGNILWESYEYLPEVSSPVATRDNLFVVTSYGVVALYDTKTGELVKEHDLFEDFYSSPIIADGKIYLFSNSGKMHIFSANRSFNLISSFETGESTFATPAFTDGKIVVRTEDSIYCVVEE